MKIEMEKYSKCVVLYKIKEKPYTKETPVKTNKKFYSVFEDPLSTCKTLDDESSENE